MKSLIDIVSDAFPPELSYGAVPIEELYEFYSMESLGRPVANWTEITEEDLRHGHFGALLQMMLDGTFVNWLPAWLVMVPACGGEVRKALAAFSGCLSPRASAELGEADRLAERVSWLNSAQRKAVAAAGRELAGKHIEFFGFDAGSDIAEAWERYASEAPA
ncbi:hypothetical protein [Bosea sp. ANAM02]|uniref:hypothetical protein n=1 Tax=Bosea sp. ANAM02 TaxID=2020412 RepID=UPI00140ED190|nr:hypothetical protein [Bosea sp. ANAM02]BCB22479.1 hypothetical protein OCUBac02_53730 [Bosea sp. ANAM02]